MEPCKSVQTLNLASKNMYVLNKREIIDEIILKQADLQMKYKLLHSFRRTTVVIWNNFDRDDDDGKGFRPKSYLCTQRVVISHVTACFVIPYITIKQVLRNQS